MSFKEFVKYEFLRLKDLPETFEVYVKGYREMETKFGLGHYLIVQVIKKSSRAKQVEGLLKISPTTGASIGALVPEMEHLKDLENYMIAFEYSPDDRTILATEVKEWGQ